MTTLAIQGELIDVPQPAADPIGTALRDVFADLSPNTLRAYRRTMEDFAAFLECSSIGAAARMLFAPPGFEHLNGYDRAKAEHGHANQLAMRYRTYLVAQDHAGNTVNSRLGALAGVVKRMRRLGIVSWTLDVESVNVRGYRDTAGPGTAVATQILGGLAATETALARRDAAIIRLLYNTGLRRGEVATLTLASLDLDGEKPRVRIRGKGKSDDEWVSLPPKTAQSIRDWLKHRGDEPGPLFIRLDRVYGARGMGKLSTTSIYNLVVKYGDSVGVRVRPHGLRHTAITSLLDKTNGDARRVQKFSRHENVATVLIYDDNRRDVAGELAGMLEE